MARNVGSIEVTVDADTGKLKAQVVKGAKAAGEAGGEALEEGLSDVDGKELMAKLRKIRTEAERALAGIAVSIDIDQADVKKEIRQLETQLRAAQVELFLHPEVEDAGLQRELARIRTELKDALEAPVDARLSRADLAELVTEANEFLKIADFTIEAQLSIPTAEEAALLAEVERIERQATMHIPVEADVELGSILRARRIMEEGMARIHAQIIADVDEKSLAKANAQMRAAGNDAGRSYSQGITQRFNSAGEILVATATSTGDSVAAALSGGIAAATSVISSGFQAIAAGGLLAVPAITSFAAAMGAAVIGSQAFGDALSDINDEFEDAAAEGRQFSIGAANVQAALNRLSPEARRTAIAFADLREQLDQSRRDVQNELFAGMAETLRDLGATVIPDVTDALKIAAREVNTFGRNLAEIAKDTDFSAIADELAPSLRNAFRAAEQLVATLEPFLKASAPAAAKLSGSIADAAESMREWVETNPDELADFLDDGVESLRRWGGLLESVGDLLATIFKAGADSGDDFVVSLDRMVARWDAFLESAEGQDALASFFESGREAVEALQPVVDGLKEAFDLLVTEDSKGQFVELMDALGAALPTVAEFLALLGDLKMGEAFLNLLEAMRPVLDLLNSLPDEVLELVGTFLIMSKTVGIVSNALQALKVANPWVLGISLALTAVVGVMDLLGDSQSDVTATTKELSASLADNIALLNETKGATDAATRGMDAFNESLKDSEGGGKIREAFAFINDGAGEAVLSMDEATAQLLQIQKTIDSDTNPALQKLAETFGLPKDAAKELSDLVAATDNNFKASEGSLQQYEGLLEDIADAAGLPKEQIIGLAQNLAELKDQAENTNLDAIVQEFIDMASTGTDAEQAAYDLARANQESGKIAAGVVPLYEELTRLLATQTEEEIRLAAAQAQGLTAQQLITESIEEQLAVADERNRLLKEERDAAYDAWRAEDRLADATRNAARGLVIAATHARDTTDELIKIGEEARTAAEAVDALSNSFDVLFGRGLDADAAFDAFHTSINDLKESLAEVDEETGARVIPRVTDLQNALTGTDEAALGFRDAIRSGVEELLAYATAATNSGTPVAEMDANLRAMRDTLVTTGAEFGLSAQEVDAYVTSLIGTPELVSTIIQTPGLIDALLNAEDLTLLYDQAGNPVITQFEALGLDPALADSKEFRALIDQLDAMKADPTITATTAAPTEEEIEAVQSAANTLGETTADPSIEASGAPAVQTQITNLQTAADTLGDTRIQPTVTLLGYAGEKLKIDTLQGLADDLSATAIDPTTSLIGYQTVNNQLDTLISKANSLDGKTVDIFVRQHGQTTFATGGIVGPGGGIGGEAGPELATYRGRSTIIDQPTSLHPGTVVTPLTGGKTVNNYMTITPLSADPEAVATSVINRAAALAS